MNGTAHNYSELPSHHHSANNSVRDQNVGYNDPAAVKLVDNIRRSMMVAEDSIKQGANLKKTLA